MEQYIEETTNLMVEIIDRFQHEAQTIWNEIVVPATADAMANMGETIRATAKDAPADEMIDHALDGAQGHLEQITSLLNRHPELELKQDKYVTPIVHTTASLLRCATEYTKRNGAIPPAPVIEKMKENQNEHLADILPFEPFKKRKRRGM